MNKGSQKAGRFAPGLLMGCLLLAGCRTAQRDRILADARINDKQVRFAYDTGSESTVIFSRQAKRLGLKVFKAPASLKPAPGKVMPGQTGFCRITVDSETYKLKLPTIPLPWPVSWLMDLGGLIGWPDIEDDFISIDAVAGTIRGVDKLPDDANGWFKLPLYTRTGVLAVEIPRADGKTGVVELDTGNDDGISLSPARWKEWRGAHKHAHWKPAIGFMPGSGFGISRRFRADDVTIGPLTWKKVAVRKANRTELGIVGKGDVSEGSIGMLALRKLDVIIDQKGHTAYLRPRPEVKGPPPTVAAARSAVHLRWRAPEQWALAVDAYYSGNFDGALQNINRFLEIQPNNWAGFNLRGVIHYAAQQLEDAAWDFRRAGELSPEFADYGHYYVWIIRARMGQQPAATQELAGYLAQDTKPKDDPWAAKAGAFLLDRLAEADFLRAVSTDPGDKGEHQSIAWYFAGIKHRLAGDTTGARDDFRQCLATERNDDDVYQFAAAELKTLEKSR
jgi:hypothetical protein